MQFGFNANIAIEYSIREVLAFPFMRSEQPKTKPTAVKKTATA
jgi:hypothetical protein